MTTDQTTDVNSLAAQVDAVTAIVARAIEACDDEQWQIVIGSEGRSVGVVFHHIASAYPLIAGWAVDIARGADLPAVSFDDIHAMNHQHAEAHANVDRATTLALMSANGAAVHEMLAPLSDADWQATAPFALVDGPGISTAQMVEWFLINHAQGHLNAINEALALD